MSKRLILFAASRDQTRYFEALTQHVSLSGKQVLAVKSSQVPFAFQALSKVFSPLPLNVLEAIEHQVCILQNRKKASRKGRGKAQWFWSFFGFVETLRAKYLFGRYSLWLAHNRDALIGVWNGKKFRQAILVIAAQQQKVPLVFFETGPLPGYSVVDPEGVDFYAAIPRRIDFYKQYQCRLKPEEQLKFEAVKKSLDLPESYIFIPFQVVEDSNIYLHSPWIKDMRALYSEIEALAEKFSHQQFVIKPHPACPEDYTDIIDKHHPQIHFVLDKPTIELVQHAEAVITVNSTVGMEALIAHKKVIVMGQAIYGFEGLTQPVSNQSELIQALGELETWQLDESAVNNYLCYLQEDYAIPGDAMKGPTDEHWAILSKKLQLCLDGQAYQSIGL